MHKFQKRRASLECCRLRAAQQSEVFRIAKYLTSQGVRCPAIFAAAQYFASWGTRCRPVFRITRYPLPANTSVRKVYSSLTIAGDRYFANRGTVILGYLIVVMLLLPTVMLLDLSQFLHMFLMPCLVLRLLLLLSYYHLLLFWVRDTSCSEVSLFFVITQCNHCKL